MIQRIGPSPTRLEESEEMTKINNPIDILQIKKAKCNRYVPNREKSADMCCCGRKINEHNEEVVEVFRNEGPLENEKWEFDKEGSGKYVAEDGLTDAFGEIKFIDSGDSIAKYIRVYYKTEIQKIIDLLYNHWKLKEPKLLISVTGGAQKFSMKPSLKDAFRRGLVKAALSTGAWISTGGFNVGVMKHVGEAIRTTSTLGTSDKIVVLGIASWTMVQNNEKLIRKLNYDNDTEPIDYSLISKEKKDKKQPLDPNHSHFILVDNAKIGFGGEIDFRAALESKIAEGRKLDNNKRVEIPMVLLVLEGGIGTLKTVYESVKKKTPCVFVEGSGKCADIFSYALKYLQKEDNSDKTLKKVENEIKDRIRKAWPESNVNVEIAYKQIEETITKEKENINLLTVFSLSDLSNSTFEIDIAILTALLQAKKDQYINQLQLALKWNRVDIASDYILNQDNQFEPAQLDEIMYQAILSDRVDFVNLLLEHGFNLGTFLTNRCLLKLYNDALTYKKNKKTFSYLALMGLKKKLYSFQEIGRIISTLIEDLYKYHFQLPQYDMNIEKILKETNQFGKQEFYLQKTSTSVTNIYTELDLDGKFANPEMELMILAILLIRPEMAKLFWKHGSNEIFLAILATKIFKTLASINDDESDEFKKLADDFEEMAINVLTDCYERDETKAELLLLNKVPVFGHLTSLQVAMSAEDLTFISHPCVQGLLTKIWYNKIMPDSPKYKIAIGLTFPPLAPFLIEYRDDRRQKVSGDTSYSDKTKMDYMDSGRKLKYLEKIYYFLKAPVVKFLYTQFFYILFLALFSYVMLCDFFPVPRPDEADERTDTSLGFLISIPEVVLIFWILMHILDEIREFLETDTKTNKARLRVYFSSIWNSITVFAIFLFIIGLILRFIPDNRDTYIAARVVLCFDLILWFIKSLSFYSIIRNLGPKLVMINRMLTETIYFVFLVIVFLFAFGVSTQSLMFHNQELDANLLKQVFFPSYFVIGGEYYTLDSILTADECDKPSNITAIELSDIYSQDDCPEITGAKVTSAIYVAYLIILNILLVNLLIAIFSNTFDEVQNETDKIWKSQRYSLIYEYFHKPIFAPPFSIFSYFVSLVRCILRPLRRYCCAQSIPSTRNKNMLIRLFNYLTKDWTTGFKTDLKEKEMRELNKWENQIADEYIHAEAIESKETNEYKIQLALEKIEVLNRKFDDMLDKRDKYEEKINQVLDLLLNQNLTHGRSTSPIKIDIKPFDNEKTIDSTPTKGEKILPPIHKDAQTITAIETPNKIDVTITLNSKSRTPRYPKSNVTRTSVPDDKVPWTVSWPDYNPIIYTAESVLLNPNADNNLLAYPSFARPNIEFNTLDNISHVYRSSCIGKYIVIDGMPLNPIGRTGVSGRGSLMYWGPNHCIEAIITRWKRDSLEEKYLLDSNNKKILQFITINKVIQSRDWHLPHVLTDKIEKEESILMNDLMSQVFDMKTILDNIGKFKAFLRKGEKMAKFYKDSQRNTDNAWIETTVVNFHDEVGDLLKLPFRESNYLPFWKDFTKKIMQECQEDWQYLTKIAENRHASFE